MIIYYTTKDWDIVVTVDAEDEWDSFSIVKDIIPTNVGFYKNPEHKNVIGKKQISLEEFKSQNKQKYPIQ